jgi:hypothetical protein
MKSITFDQHPTNVESVKVLEVTVEQTSFQVNGEAIVVFFDAPHL